MASTSSDIHPLPPRNNPPRNPHELIFELETRLTEIKREMTRLQIEQEEKTRALHEQREIVNASSFVNKTLPDDILFNIFSIVVLADHDVPHPGPPQPLALGAVCQRWRRVCLDHPTLWSWFTVWSPDAHHCEEDRYDVAAVSRVLLQLERSQSAPLHIALDTPICACACQETIFRALVAYSHRWELLMLDSDDAVWTPEDIHTLQKLIPRGSNFSKLQAIYCQNTPTLDPPNSDGLLSNLIPFLDFSALTSLNSFTVKTSVGDFPKSLNFPWGQLTFLSLALHYDANAGAHRELLLTLTNCPKLTVMKIVFDDGFWDDVDDIAKDSIVLPYVTAAHIDIDRQITPGSPATVPLVPYIRLPKLRSLAIEDLQREGLSIAVVDMIKRSSCSQSLKKLSLSLDVCKDGSIDDLRTLLSEIPWIESLFMDHLSPSPPDAYNSSSLVQLLVMENAGDPAAYHLCPRLTDIDLSDFNPNPMTVAQMVDSRKEDLTDEAGKSPFYLKRLKWRYPGNDAAYAFCKTLMEQRYSVSPRFRLEMSQSLDWLVENGSASE